MLNVGDVIKLEKGMCVYAMIPSKFVTANRIFSNELTQEMLIVGELYHNETREKQVQKAIENIAKGVVERFSWEGAHISIEDSRVFVNEIVEWPLPETFEIEPGEFLVVKTISDGGSERDFYPNGWHVFLKRLDAEGNYDPNGLEVNFYETGSFTCVNEDVSVVRKMTPTYV